MQTQSSSIFLLNPFFFFEVNILHFSESAWKRVACERHTGGVRVADIFHVPVWPGLRILASMPYVGWGCCWSTPLLREVFLRVLRFLPLLKKPAPLNYNSIWNPRTHFSEFLRTHKCSVGKQITTNYKFTRYQNLVTRLRQSANDDLSTDKILNSYLHFIIP